MRIIDLVRLIDGYFTNLPSIYEINNFKTDSREVCENDCFIAINKGYLYIEDAIKNKCGLIITDKLVDIKTDIGIIRVDDSIEALCKIASYIRDKNKKIPLVAVTGSLGKTTTKELIYNILKSKYNVLKSESNNNNIIGLSNTLLKLDDKYDVVVLEMGMNHKGEIKRLSDIAKPDLAVITNIASNHIGNLGSIKNIMNAKLEITSGMDSLSTLILNKYDNNSYKIKSDKVICNRCLDIDYKNIKVDDKLYFDLIYNDNIYPIMFNTPNIKMVDNIIQAIEVCTYFNIDILDMVNVINNYTVSNRMIIHDIKNYKVIDDTYNSSYESILGVIPYLKNIDNLIIVLGDILELGKYSKHYHKLINKKIKKLKCTIITCGEYTKYIKGIHFNNIESVIDYLNSIDLVNHTIYLKASNKMNFKYIVDYLLGNS